MFRLFLISTVVSLLTLSHSQADGRSEEQTVRSANEVLQEFLNLSVREIPESMLDQAYGVAIFPDVIKVGFVVGGQYGHGVVVIRQPDGSWRAPAFITITGGSLGWQIGAQSTDFVLVFKSQKSVDGLLRGKFTLGADAAVAAGPVGRRAGAATDTALQAEIYTYSRSRGLFAGVSLEGSALQIDDAANASYYGANGGAAPPSATLLVQTIARLSNQPPAAAVVPSANLVQHASNHLDTVKADLARQAVALNVLLDDGWRRYLALPAEVFDPGKRPSAADVEAALNKFQFVARNRQFQALSSRPEFQATHGLLQTLLEDLKAATAGSSQLALPPPPAQGR